MASNGDRVPRQRVLIAGGGFAGIETALALRDLAADRVEVDLYDPCREFVSKPFAVGEPYGAGQIFRYDLRRLAEGCGASFQASGIVSVDVEARVAVTRDGGRLPYDYLVVASGVRMLWAMPGAVNFWGVADEGQVGDLIADLRAGELRRLVLTMPGGCSWTLPLYELALLGASALAKVGIGGARIIVVTPEDAPLELFGRRASEQMGRLLEEQGVELIAGADPVRFAAGRLQISPGGEVEADAVISLPRLEGRRVNGIPHDAEGFVGVDEHGRVNGLKRVFAAGDVTAFPLKQRDVAVQQADAVAEAIAADLGAEIDPRPFSPILNSVLWAGTEQHRLHGQPTVAFRDKSVGPPLAC